MSDIFVPEKSIEVIKEALYKQERIKSELAAYANGLRQGLNIPDNWLLNRETKAFVSPQEDGHKSIPIPLKTISVIEDAYRKLEEIDSQLKSYKLGLLHALGVPENWHIDIEKKIVLSPEEQK